MLWVMAGSDGLSVRWCSAVNEASNDIVCVRYMGGGQRCASRSQDGSSAELI